MKVGLLLLTALIFRLGCGNEDTSSRVNVLHIIIDDFQLHGGSMAGAMPHLNDFASSGVTFTRAYCQSPICTVSRTSFLTGRQPGRFGMAVNPSFRDAPSSSRWSSLPGYFKANNYTVLGLGKTWHEGSPPAWDGDLSWSSSSSSREGVDNRIQLPGDIVAAALGYEYWPPADAYKLATTDIAWTAPCAGAAPVDGGRDPATGQRLPGSFGHPSCWADTAPLSATTEEEINDSEDLLFYDGQLAHRAVNLLKKLANTTTIEQSNSHDGSAGNVMASPAPPWYLAVGFHQPHTPWVVPRRDWEALASQRQERRGGDDLRNKSEMPTGLAASQRLPPVGMPPLAGCAGKGCLSVVTFVAPPSNPSSSLQSNETTTDVVRLESPEDFDPWRPLNATTQAMLRGGYRAALGFVDRQLGKILAALDDTKAEAEESNVVVLVHSDHGLDLGDHGHWLKRTLHESTLRVPFVLRVPPSVLARSNSNRRFDWVSKNMKEENETFQMRGLTTSLIVELVDIMPTLIDLAGLQPLPSSFLGSSKRSVGGGGEKEGAGLDGRSLVPALLLLFNTSNNLLHTSASVSNSTVIPLTPPPPPPISSLSDSASVISVTADALTAALFLNKISDLNASRSLRLRRLAVSQYPRCPNADAAAEWTQSAMCGVMANKKGFVGYSMALIASPLDLLVASGALNASVAAEAEKEAQAIDIAEETSNFFKSSNSSQRMERKKQRKKERIDSGDETIAKAISNRTFGPATEASVALLPASFAAAVGSVSAPRLWRYTAWLPWDGSSAAKLGAKTGTTEAEGVGSVNWKQLSITSEGERLPHAEEAYSSVTSTPAEEPVERNEEDDDVQVREAVVLDSEGSVISKEEVGAWEGLSFGNLASKELMNPPLTPQGGSAGSTAALVRGLRLTLMDWVQTIEATVVDIKTGDTTDDDNNKIPSPSPTRKLVPFPTISPSPLPTAPPHVASASTCEGLGWFNAGMYGDPLVCGESKVDIGGGACSGLKMLDEAMAFCEGVGARLCTFSELLADEAKGTGCGYDSQLVWSSTPCDHMFDPPYAVTRGGSANDSITTKDCQVSVDENYVRCCADSEPKPTISITAMPTSLPAFATTRQPSFLFTPKVTSLPTKVEGSAGSASFVTFYVECAAWLFGAILACAVVRRACALLARPVAATKSPKASHYAVRRATKFELVPTGLPPDDEDEELTKSHGGGCERRGPRRIDFVSRSFFSAGASSSGPSRIIRVPEDDDDDGSDGIKCNGAHGGACDSPADCT